MKFLIDARFEKTLRLFDFSEMPDSPVIRAKSNVCEFEVADADIRDVQMIMNEEIVAKGMDNQDTVNAIGRDMYAIYDIMLFQLQEAKK